MENGPLFAIFISIVAIVLYFRFVGSKEKPSVGAASEEGRNRRQVIVKTYIGDQGQATSLFQRDAEQMAARGYYPISQTWTQGQYGTGSFLLALLLCLIFIGFLVFAYMLIVKPPGTLTVTYELRPTVPTEVEKTCPECAERVKQAAVVCRYCGHKFGSGV